MKRPKQVTELLREALKTCGRTRAEVSRETGIDQAVLSRFAHGSTLQGANLDRLTECLGLTLAPIAKDRGPAAPAVKPSRTQGTPARKRSKPAAATEQGSGFNLAGPSAEPSPAKPAPTRPVSFAARKVLAMRARPVGPRRKGR